MPTLAIMQPYFLPYAGYFRLFAASDRFVIYDCVQFPRRGWVHRNYLRTHQNQQDWFTLPLAKAPQNTCITELRWGEHANEKWWRESQEKFPTLQHSALNHTFWPLATTPLEHIVATLKATCAILDLPFNIEYSSALKLPENLRGEDRILAILKHFGATRYINAPGGTELYTHEHFQRANIELSFLTPYNASKESILERITHEDPRNVRREIQTLSTFQDL